MNGPNVIVMCKAPVPGRVKTRLMSEFSADDAARIHTAMATTVIRRAASLFDSVYIAADDTEHAFFQPFGLPIVAQGRGSLGDRMARLAGRAFAEHAGAVIFLGTDSPHMTEKRLRQAAGCLRESDVVVGPVEDGGYDLIGLAGDWPVFAGVEWSSPEVLNQTLANCRDLGLSCRQLALSFDIDTAADLARANDAGWHWQDVGMTGKESA
ncbi:MAG: TIGR04282 family arsenosugar biosynthesis glycosyltransferase [Mariprofundaceae bacterium]